MNVTGSSSFSSFFRTQGESTDIHEVNTMFVEERKKAMNRYKEQDGCHLGHYAQWFFFVLLGSVFFRFHCCHNHDSWQTVQQVLNI